MFCCPLIQEKQFMSPTPTKIEDTAFWKRVAREYVASEEAKLEKENILTKHSEM